MHIGLCCIGVKNEDKVLVCTRVKNVKMDALNKEPILQKISPSPRGYTVSLILAPNWCLGFPSFFKFISWPFLFFQIVYISPRVPSLLLLIFFEILSSKTVNIFVDRELILSWKLYWMQIRSSKFHVRIYYRFVFSDEYMCWKNLQMRRRLIPIYAQKGW